VATRRNYDKEFRALILKEVSERTPIEEIAEKYQIEVVVIQKWIEFDAYEHQLEHLFIDTHKDLNSKTSTDDKDRIIWGIWVKKYYLYILGVLAVIVAIIFSYYFRSAIVYPSLNEAPNEVLIKLDTIIHIENEIESTLLNQHETTISISNSVNNNVINTGKIQRSPRRRSIPQSQKKDTIICVCKCCDCDNDTIK